jgi:hypothetical protein
MFHRDGLRQARAPWGFSYTRLLIVATSSSLSLVLEGEGANGIAILERYTHTLPSQFYNDHSPFNHGTIL